MAKTMVISLGSSRRRKRGEVLFRFDSFCQPGYPAQLAGAFRDNVRTLLGLAHLEAGAPGETRCWSFQLELHRHPPTVVRLFVVEEEVAASPHRQCHLCRVVGWGRHLICSKRFHFVMPKRESSVETDGLCYGVGGHSGGGTDKASKGTATSRGHLLHGIVHLNGYGHLVGIHGFEGGSDFVSGHQIMDLWDRICSALHVRKVSLVDTARKGHMVLRLLHGVAYGDTWFGRWGYRYGRPSYGVALQAYQQSLHALQSVPLCVLLPHLNCFTQDLPMLVTKYQAISGHKLLNLGDLLRFMLDLRTRLPATSVTAMDYRGIMSDASCRWSAKRVDMAARAVVDALRRSSSDARWVTRQEVRDAARAYIGDTGLLDFVLKSLGNHIVGNYVVRRAMNPVTKVLEYCLEDVSSVLPAAAPGAGVATPGQGKMRVRFHLTRAQLMRDLVHLYRHVLKEPSQALTTGAFGAIPVAVRMVLDIKHFVKDYHEGTMAATSNGGIGHVYVSLCCTLVVRNGGPELVPPYETVTVPAHATVGELKWEVQRLFRDMYLALRTFTAESVLGIGAGQDASAVLGLIGVGSTVVVEGVVDEEQQAEDGDLKKEAPAICEGSGDVGERVVDCVCGADDDDGERMACCDICEAWQHTRCAGVADAEDVPHVFLCSRCDNDVVSFPALSC